LNKYQHFIDIISKITHEHHQTTDNKTTGNQRVRRTNDIAATENPGKRSV